MQEGFSIFFKFRSTRDVETGRKKRHGISMPFSLLAEKGCRLSRQLFAVRRSALSVR